jgi:hypothetical protein
MMKTIQRNKLVLRRETIKALMRADLDRAKGGIDDTDCRGQPSRAGSTCPIADAPFIIPG